MKHLLVTTIAAVLLVGCGESQQSAPAPETKLAKPVNPKANKALLNAVKKGEIEAAKQAIADGADVNGEGEYGMTPMEGTPLHLAVSQDRHEIIELIIAKGANVNVKDMFFTLTPLDWAVKLNKTETIKLLQKHGGKSAAQDSIHIAAQLGNIEAVKKHLDLGADINSTAEGLLETPLDFTAEINTNSYATLRTVGLPEDTVEIKAAKKEIVGFLRKRGGKHSSIYEAAKGGDLEGIKEFLAAGVDPDEKTGFTFGQTPLYVASTKEVVDLLIANGADVNAKDNMFGTPLDYTIRRKRTEIADLLRKHGGKTGEELKAAEPVAEASDISIWKAARIGNIEAVKQHLAAGMDVNAKTTAGETPLHYAAIGGHKEIAELLIADGADLNTKDFRGNTPLDYAIIYENKETANLLHKHGAKTRDWLEAEDAIYTAARVGHIEAVKQHLAKGTDVNAKNEEGYTPLHYAAAFGQKEVAELLIAKGADVNAKGVDGRTPLGWAISNDETETADLLRKHGGKTGDWLKVGDSIHIAAKAGHIEAVKKHLADGADVNAIGKFRKASPLYMAAYSYSAEAAKFLLENGADVHQLDFEKETALHTAAYHSYHGEGDVSVVALLVDHGSKINAISDRGLTPLDLAIMAGTPEVSDLLRKHGGKTGEELKAEGK